VVPHENDFGVLVVELIEGGEKSCLELPADRGGGGVSSLSRS